MKDSRTPTKYSTDLSRQDIAQALINDQDTLRAEAGKLAAESAAASDATSWFELLYQAAARGEASVPWASLAPNPHLVQWARARSLRGTGRTALVVGCGFGDDAEFVASLGFTVVAFDISPTAIAGARSRFPGSSVDYTPADLLNPPASWRGAFDLVVEIYTVQPLHGAARTTALAMLPRLVAPDGTLLVIAHATEEPAPERDPSSFPWPLTRAEIDSAADILHPVKIELLRDHETPSTLRWRAEFNCKTTYPSFRSTAMADLTARDRKMSDGHREVGRS
jgi:SAM-dependent methyltransferase